MQWFLTGVRSVVRSKRERKMSKTGKKKKKGRRSITNKKCRRLRKKIKKRSMTNKKCRRLKKKVKGLQRIKKGTRL